MVENERRESCDVVRLNRISFSLQCSNAALMYSVFQRMLMLTTMDQARSGDTVVVWKPDRLARSTRDLLNTMEALGDVGAKFQSLPAIHHLTLPALAIHLYLP